jgi:hypothetical protein
MTLVLSASRIDECGLPRKSIETSGSSQTWRIPFKGPSAAFFIASLMPSAVASLASITERSTTETSEVGTRRAKPSRRPLSSGSTSPMARAAPVLVGIIETAAARARRRSLWGKSSVTWSLV